MSTDTLTHWASTHPYPAAAVTCTALALTAAAVWLAVRAARSLTLPPPYVLFVGFAAAVCTAYSADTSWRFAEHRLGMTDPVERAVMFAAAEIALLACTVMARANVRAGTTEDRIGSPGLPGTLVWVITGVQIIPSYSESGFWGGTVRAVFGPVLAGLLWHQVMGLEVKVARPRALSSGLVQQIGRELRERLLAHLGLAQRGRDAQQIARDLATARAVRLASRRWLGPWGRSRLAAAVARSSAGLNPDQKQRLLQQLAARRGATGLRTVDLPSPWEPELAPVQPRTLDGLIHQELTRMHPVDAVLRVREAHPDATPAEIASLCTAAGVVVSETQVRIALRASSSTARHAPVSVPEAEGVPALGAAERVQHRPVSEVVPAGARLLPIVARPAPATDEPPVPAEAANVLVLDLDRLYPYPHPEVCAPVAAAAVPRREVRVTLPTAPVPEGDDAALIADARTEYADLLTDGRTPSIRTLRTRYRIGQDRAQRLQAALAQEPTR